MIKDDRKGKYFHSLSYNDDFDFRDLASKLLKSDIQENLKIFDRFIFIDYPTEDQVKELHDYLDEAINERYKRLAYQENDPFTYPPSREKRNKRKSK